MEQLRWIDAERLFEELLASQENKLLSCAQRIVPHVTRDDLLQPNDYHELEEHPYFRYEEGVCEGLRTAYTALRALIRDSEHV